MMYDDESLTIAYRMGSYQALANMMRDATITLASATNDLDRDWATKRLVMLAEQFDDAEERFKG